MKEAQRGAWRLAILYAVLLLLILSATTIILLHTLRQSTQIRLPATPEEIYVYLPQETQESSSESNTETETGSYIVKEHHGLIGVFSSEGALLEIWDTYVKTLPEADRTLLREGITIKTKAELNALMEDYSH